MTTLKYITAMREYSEFTRKILAVMRMKNEPSGAVALSETVVSKISSESELEAIITTINSGSFNPLDLVNGSLSAEGRNINSQWAKEVKSSLFTGLTLKSLTTNLPWDNVLYEPEEEFLDGKLEEKFARWDLGYSVAKYLWSEKIKREEPTLASTISNDITRRLGLICEEGELINSTKDLLESIEYLQKNETILADISRFQLTDELVIAIIALMQLTSVIGSVGNGTINIYSKGSDVYKSAERVIQYEIEKENANDEIHMFITKYLKFVAFTADSTKLEVIHLIQNSYKEIVRYIESCKPVPNDSLLKLAQYGLKALSNYTEMNKSYLEDTSERRTKTDYWLI
ncbi:hypothetical protein QYM36_014669 [Artemia franciscana]|uniref:Uncharacterized protein n=2 Tax=Artemia franciscana TaxID=6661 RepID=A0AA88HKT6_ARTSF|nr:hypothetical protein QYM36_014669 [Artemia franciscana]